jgi:hypothetical protein
MNAVPVKTDDPVFKANFASYLRETRLSLARLEDLVNHVDILRRREWFDDLRDLTRKADDITSQATKFAVARVRPA